jgi:hypothetical protein
MKWREGFELFYKIEPVIELLESTSWTPGVGLEPCNYIHGLIQL